jgi:hypothetical protein
MADSASDAAYSVPANLDHYYALLPELGDQPTSHKELNDEMRYKLKQLAGIIEVQFVYRHTRTHTAIRLRYYLFFYTSAPTHT